MDRRTMDRLSAGGCLGPVPDRALGSAEWSLEVDGKENHVSQRPSPQPVRETRMLPESRPHKTEPST